MTFEEMFKTTGGVIELQPGDKVQIKALEGKVFMKITSNSSNYESFTILCDANKPEMGSNLQFNVVEKISLWT